MAKKEYTLYKSCQKIYLPASKTRTPLRVDDVFTFANRFYVRMDNLSPKVNERGEWFWDSRMYEVVLMSGNNWKRKNDPNNYGIMG